VNIKREKNILMPAKNFGVISSFYIKPTLTIKSADISEVIIKKAARKKTTIGNCISENVLLSFDPPAI